MTEFPTRFSRREFLLAAGASALGSVFLKGCTTNPNASNQVQPISPAYANSEGLETTTARLGFVGQTDAAPLVIAKEKGFFAKYGVMDVKLVKQPSWGVTRDNLQLGSKGGGVDGAMVLTPMPYQMSLGTATVNNKKIPMYSRFQVSGVHRGARESELTGCHCTLSS